MQSNAKFSSSQATGKSMKLLAAFALVFWTPLALASLDEENLLQTLPRNFRVAYKDGNERGALTELVPSNESVENWTEMVTTQIYYGVTRDSFETYRREMEQRWKSACDYSEVNSITDGAENGYPFQLWMQSCHFNDQGRKPEITWFKMIRGSDSAYVVQVALRFEPTKEKITQWMTYLQNVYVCDSRIKGHECDSHIGR